MSRASRRGRGASGLALAGLAVWAAGAVRLDAQPPFPLPPPPSFSPTVPVDVALPTGFPPNMNPIDYFDDYSWRAFIAMVWPGKSGARGQPDAAAGLDGPGPRVFETFRSNWETFAADGAPPPPWNGAAGTSPCPAAGANDLVLASFSKFEELAQAGFGVLTGPLVAQSKTFVRYATGYDEVQYGHILDRKLYLRANLPAAASPTGALVVKSAWIELPATADASRYYTRKAWVLQPGSTACQHKDMALVGLHIVQKTPTRPQWIWTTFEHDDTAPDATAAPAGKFDFNDGSAAVMAARNPNSAGVFTPMPPPNQVQRLRPVANETNATNALWRNALAAKGSVWANYRLVMTQWPLRANSTDTGGPDNTFPGRGSDTTAFANVVLETYEQKRISSGCMACHDLTRAETDFVWSVNTHAFPRATSPTPAALFATRGQRQAADALARLKKRLQDATR